MVICYAHATGSLGMLLNNGQKTHSDKTRPAYKFNHNNVSRSRSD